MRTSDSRTSNPNPVERLPTRSVEPEWLSRTIGAIYDCILVPSGWTAVLREITHKLAFLNATLAIGATVPGEHQVLVQYGFDQEWLDAGPKYQSDMIQVWGGLQRVEAFALDEPVIWSNIMTVREARRYAYYREISEPRGVTDGVIIPLSRGPHLMGYFGSTRHGSAGAISTYEVDALRFLGPHLRRAVTISRLFDLTELERATFRAVLDAMRHAVLVLDEDRSVVFSNNAANQLLREPGIAVVRNSLVFEDVRAQVAVDQALSVALTYGSHLGGRGIGIPISRSGARTLAAHVMSLRDAELRRGLSQRAAAVIFLVGGQEHEQPSAGALALAYELTPVEVQVFLSIAEGKDLRATADILGIARSTARSHLQRVFDKTGCRRQAEVVALAARLFPSIAL